METGQAGTWLSGNIEYMSTLALGASLATQRHEVMVTAHHSADDRHP